MPEPIPAPGSKLADLNQVIKDEASEIGKRRQVAVPEAQGDSYETHESVGLALSGGGIRSAMFNLGLLQALSHRGLLRYVDYISSVSGGGYIAGYLASRCRSGQGPNFHKDDEADLGVVPQTGQHKAGYRFGGPASYLSDVVGWGWRYIASTSLMLALFWSGLVAIGAALALAWRTLDYENVRSYFTAVNLSAFGDELTVAFLPCFLLVGLTAAAVLLRSVVTCGVVLFRSAILVCLGLGLVGSVLAYLERNLSVKGEGLVQPLPTGSVEPWFWLVPLVTMGALSAMLWVARQLAASWQGVAPDGLSPRTRLARWVLSVLWFLPSVGLLAANAAAWLGGRGDGLAGVVRGLLLLLVVACQTAFWLMVTRETPEQFVRRCERAIWWLVAAVFVAAVVSAAVFLGNGEATVWANQENLQLNQFVTWLSAIVLFLQLVPLLGLDRLLRSNREEAPGWQKRLFQTVVGAALFAPAFFVVHLMAREDISEFASHRDPNLHSNDVLHWPGFVDVLRKWDEQIPVIAKKPPGRGAPRLENLRLLKEKGIGPLLKQHGQGPQSVLASQGELLQAQNGVSGQFGWPRWENRPGGTWAGTARSAALTAQHVLGLDGDSKGSLTAYRAAWETDRRRRREFVKAFNDDVLKTAALTDLLLHEVVVRAGSHSEPGTKARRANPLPLREIEPADVDAAAVTTFVESLRGRLAKEDSQEAKQFMLYWHRLGRANLPGIPSGESLPTFAQISKNVGGWQNEEIAAFNRLLMEALYPDLVRPRTMVSTGVVAYRDQMIRVLWLIGGVAVFGVLLLCVDFNQNSPFYWFYWRRLDRYFLEADGKPDSKADDPLRLAQLDTCARGLPYFLFAGTLMLRRRQRGQVLPVNQLFLFSKLYCGTAEVGYRRTEDYRVYDEHPAGDPPGDPPRNGQGQLRLGDAVTISGSAITPFMVGDRTWLSILMTAFNLRLGQWLPHPDPQRKSPQRGRWLTAILALTRSISACMRRLPWWGRCLPAVSAWTAGREYLRSFSSEDVTAWDYGFVADGGYHEFLGVEELLRRRCRLIICSDAGFNTGRHEFGSLAAMVRTARERVGIEFLDLDHDEPVDIDRFRHDAGAENRVPQQILGMRIVYPETESGGPPSEGLLFYIQMALTGRESTDLQQFRHQNPEFPEEPTTNQNFTAGQVESYRQLGAHIGRILCRELPPHRDAPQWKSKAAAGLKYQEILDEVIHRLRLAYQWECLREVTYLCRDVCPEALFAEAGRLRLPDGPGADLGANPLADPFNMLGQSADQWLHRYDGDADFRNFHRHRVAQLAARQRSETAECPAGRLAVTILALHELSGQAESRAALEAGVNRSLPQVLDGQFPRVFQVGGRQRLIRACENFCRDWPQWLAETGEVVTEMRNGRGARDPRTQLLAAIATEVFTAHGRETADLFRAIQGLPPSTGAVEAPVE